MKTLLFIFAFVTSIWSQVQINKGDVFETKNLALTDIIDWKPQVAGEFINKVFQFKPDFLGPVQVSKADTVFYYNITTQLEPSISDFHFFLHDSIQLLLPRQSIMKRGGTLKITQLLPGEFPSRVEGQSAKLEAFCISVTGVNLDSNFQLKWLGESPIKTSEWYFFKPDGTPKILLDSLLSLSDTLNSYLIIPKENPICFAPMSAGFAHKRIALDIHPNPFSPYISGGTTISFKPGMSHDQAISIKLEVLDRFGKLKTLLDLDHTNQQTQSVIWDGRDDKGNPLNNGRYLLRLKVKSISSNEKYQEVKPVVLFK
jgi:hypothetical protein